MKGMTLTMTGVMHLTNEQLEWVSNHANGTATGDGVMFVDTEALAEALEFTQEQPPDGLLRAVLDFCQRESVSLIYFYN